MTMAIAAPDSNNGSPQGHCSHCGKVWILNERQGICQWCAHLAVCQNSTAKPRHFKSRSNGYKRQAPVHSNGYDQLSEPYLTYYKVASRFNHKAKAEDTQDLLHDIILTLARAERNNGHQPFTEAIMYRIASYTQAHYWYKHYKLTMGLDCGHCSKAQRQKCKECPKAVKVESLNKPVIDGEGHTTELGELIADNKAIDISAWIDARTFLLGFPQRLLLIADKLNSGDNLTHSDSQYLYKFRKREQIKLFAG